MKPSDFEVFLNRLNEAVRFDGGTGQKIEINYTFYDDLYLSAHDMERAIEYVASSGLCTLDANGTVSEVAFWINPGTSAEEVTFYKKSGWILTYGVK